MSRQEHAQAPGSKLPFSCSLCFIEKKRQVDIISSIRKLVSGKFARSFAFLPLLNPLPTASKGWKT